MQSLRFLAIAVACCIGCAVWIRFLRNIAAPLGLVDRPGGRKRHESPMPVVGGIAMFLGLIPLLLSGMSDAFYLGGAMLLVVVVGILDDEVQLSARTRLAMEVAAALVLVAGGTTLRYVGDLLGLGPIGTAFLAPAITVVCVTGTINAVNMSDGLDGLAGAQSFVAIGWLTAAALLSGNGLVFEIGLCALGVIAGFLAYNLRTRFRTRACVFMGDAGSMLLGLLVAWLAIELAGKGPSVLTPIGAVWIVGVPLLDMGSVMANRMRHGGSPFRADRRHFHYLLVDAGMAQGEVVRVLVSASVFMGAAGLLFPVLHIPEWLMFGAFLALWGAGYRWVERQYRQPAPAALPTALGASAEPAIGD
ncbi:MAG: MraY family glycosyltransferase [Burkholderiales bacterium]